MGLEGPMNEHATRKDDGERLRESVRRARELVGPDESGYERVSDEEMSPADLEIASSRRTMAMRSSMSNGFVM